MPAPEVRGQVFQNGFKGGLSAENYLAITGTSSATATRDLSDLVGKGVLVRTGERRHARYWLDVAGVRPYLRPSLKEGTDVSDAERASGLFSVECRP